MRRACLVSFLFVVAVAGCQKDDGPSQRGFCSNTCVKDCNVDNDCDVTQGELCCDFSPDGKACLPASECPRFCTNDSTCDAESSEACVQVVLASSRKLCTASEFGIRTCADDSACLTGEKCCGIYDQKICLPTNQCPQACAAGGECNTTAGEVCCTSLAQTDPTLNVAGLCLHPSLYPCPRLCQQSSDCQTAQGEICCDGQCATSCAKRCDTSAECPGQICCKSPVLRSPLVTGRLPGYPVTPTSTGGSGGGGCTNTCSWAYDGECDDGGSGSVTNLCTFGTDCGDCGSRGAAGTGGTGGGTGGTGGGTGGTGGSTLCANSCSWAYDGECDDGGSGSVTTLCTFGSDCADCGSRVSSGLCSNTCGYSADGDCDDGGIGSDYSLCPLGTDCTDCGPR